MTELSAGELARALGSLQPKERKACAQCGEEFVGVLRAKYCGQLCINAAYRQRNREELNRKRREKYRRLMGEGHHDR